MVKKGEHFSYMLSQKELQISQCLVHVARIDINNTHAVNGIPSALMVLLNLYCSVIVGLWVSTPQIQFPVPAQTKGVVAQLLWSPSFRLFGFLVKPVKFSELHVYTQVWWFHQYYRYSSVKIYSNSSSYNNFMIIMHCYWLFGVLLMWKTIAVVNTAAIGQWELRFALHETLETALISPNIKYQKLRSR